MMQTVIGGDLAHSANFSVGGSQSGLAPLALWRIHGQFAPGIIGDSDQPRCRNTHHRAALSHFRPMYGLSDSSGPYFFGVSN